MKRFLIAFSIILSLNAHSQNKGKAPINYKLVLGINPLAPLQDDNVLMLCGEWRFKDKVALVGDAGYIFNSYYLENVKAAKGFIIRPALRQYLNDRNNFYGQVQLFYKKVNYHIQDSVTIIDNNGQTTREKEDFWHHKSVEGVNFMIGTIQPLFKGKAFIDLYLGIGMRQKQEDLTAIGIPDDDIKNLENPILSKGSAPSLPMGIKFIVLIK
jgi:hypothetical protein